MFLDGRTHLEIIITREDPVAELAAEELARYLSLCLGRRMERTVRSPGRPETAVPAGTARFVLSGGKPDPFARDEFLLEISRDRVLVDGSSHRAVLYGVYELLERSIGVFWDRPGSEEVPHRDSLELAPARSVVEPDLDLRGFYLDSSAKSMTPENTAALIDWMAKKRANYLLVSVNFFEAFRESIVPDLRRRGIILEVGHHGFVNFVDPERHMAEHPEWFSLVDGRRTSGFRRNNMTHDAQLCSSNEEGLAYYADRLADYLSRYPEIDVLGVIPNDGKGWCECDSCRALEDAVEENLLLDPTSRGWGQMNASGRYHRIVSAVARRLNERYSDVVGRRKLSFWAYNSTIMPSPTLAELPSNVMLSGFALYERCYAHDLGDAACDEYPFHLNGAYRSIVEKWRNAFAGPMVVYEYYRKYIWLSKPKIMPDTIHRDADYLASAGFSGLTSMCEVDAWPIYEVNQHAFLDYPWSDRALPGRDYLDAFARRKLPGSAGLAARLLREVVDIMGPFGLLGGRFPETEIEPAMRRIDALLEVCAGAGDAAADDAGDRQTAYFAAWRENLAYMKKALASDRAVIAAIREAEAADAGQPSPQVVESLEAALERDRDLLAFVTTMSAESFLHSEYVTNRIGRRMEAISELRTNLASSEPPEQPANPAATLRAIWEAGWF